MAITSTVMANWEVVSGALLAGFLFVAGWTVMTVAMMLPTSVPLLTLFHRLTARERIAGSSRPWLCRLPLHLDALRRCGLPWRLGLHQVAEQVDGWRQRLGAGAGPLMLAGMYQFTP